MAPTALAALIGAELHTPVAAAARAMAEHCRARHGTAAIAVLFYGSCLRQPDQLLGDALLDFYVIVDDYRAAYDKRLLALANDLLPPNVFYVELPWQGLQLRAKYAVISLRQFADACAPTAQNVSIWARFCQPTRLIWCRDAGTDAALTTALMQACRTMFRNAAPLLEGSAAGEPLTVWREGFKATYAAELRSEKSDRALAIVAADEERYRAIGNLLLAEGAANGISREAAMANWQGRRLLGKTLNYLRLIKAAFTFDGAVDYVLWKVRRHSGVVVPVSDWQRRHPLLAAPALAWKLYRRGAFR
ncbi:hypothetical protein [Dongia rigui]|uniref:Phosphatidate cytidylyltransferase n=1 Tax=Dongia rigui TaxID=940149 RepID=A0ABU5E5R5_9PROT|nr:hypothetical protein [Dongia rigui]MDY0874293.1 hypothetical protein [Dongia rigui]